LGHVNAAQVPEELTSRFGDVYFMLKCLDTDKIDRVVDNPQYRAPLEGQDPPANAPPQYITESVELSAEERRNYRYDIRDICSPLAKTLSK
jgi:hypothetical protein